jgi:hypothetical protein
VSQSASWGSRPLIGAEVTKQTDMVTSVGIVEPTVSV